MTPDRRNATKHGWFTTWQWAVLGAYFVTIVLAVSIYGLAHRADENARRGTAAICVEVAFLENSRVVTERSIQQHPNAPESELRRQSLKRLDALTMQLRREIPSCRDALK